MKTICVSFVLGFFFFNLQSQIAVYNFTNGLGIDATGNGNIGTFFGNSTLGDSLIIDATTNNYFQIPSSVLNNKLEFSIAFRIKFNNFNLTGSFPTNHIFSGDLPNLEGSFATSYQKNINSWYFVNGNSAFTFTDNSILINQWYCVALTRDANGLIKMYVDGVQNASTFIDGSPLSMTSLLLGQETDCFNGCFAANQSSNAKFDYLNIYSSALSINALVTVCSNNNLVNREEIINDNYFFQNPISEELRIENASNIQMIEVFSVDGKRLLSLPHSQNPVLNVSMQELKPGVYYLKIVSGKTISSYKMVKY